VAVVDDGVWTALEAVSQDLRGLLGRCLAADGGLPLLTDPAFLAARWAAPFGLRAADPASPAADPGSPGDAASAAGKAAHPARDAVASAVDAPAPTPDGRSPVRGGPARTGDGTLLAAGAVRPTDGGATFCGLVDPAARGRGIGASLLERGLAEAERVGAAHADPVIVVESDSLTDDADALFASRGLRQVFAEEVMRMDLATQVLPGPAWPAGTRLVDWSGETAARFHAVYVAAFRERPGFPDVGLQEWIDDSEDDFRPHWSVLATVPGTGDAGMVVGALDWIVQVGVVPSARRRGLGAALILEALTRMVADGATEAYLSVNVNNPGAAALYRRLGFAPAGRRGRYQR
jgi:mycothiol synthase